MAISQPLIIPRDAKPVKHGDRYAINVLHEGVIKVWVIPPSVMNQLQECITKDTPIKISWWRRLLQWLKILKPLELPPFKIVIEADRKHNAYYLTVSNDKL